MGIAKGTLSVTRYRIIGTEGILQLSSVRDTFAQWQMPDNWRETRKTEAFGWVPPLLSSNDEITHSDHWDLSHCSTPSGFALRFRVDRRRVPGEVIKLAVQDKLKEYTTRTGKAPSRDARKLLKEETMDDLLASALPTISYADALYDDRRGLAYLFHAGKSVSEKFEQLFRESFCKPLKARMIKLSPPLMGLDRHDWADSDLEKGRFSFIANTMPATFVDRPAL